MKKKCAFIGLGVMGAPMAGHLVRHGYDVCVYNRTRQKAKAWQEKYGGTYANTPKEAARGADIVFACVGNDDDLKSITLGEDGAFKGMESASIFVDHTTASANIARHLYEEAKTQGIAFLDAPVSGGQAGAENGKLTIMVGGDKAAFDIAAPVMASFSHKCALIGPSGCGQLTKMVNQICIAGIVQGLSEAILFAQQAKLDVPAVLDVIGGGAAQSWQMQNRGLTMHDDKFDFGFAVDWMRKDLGIVLDEARQNGAPLPLTALVDQFYGDVQSMGGGRWDTSSLIRRLRRIRS